MGESLKDLEARLEQLVPRGLSNSGRERLDAQIDELAAGVGTPTARRSPWVIGLGIAAAAVAMAAVVHFSRPGPGAAPLVETPAGPDTLQKEPLVPPFVSGVALVDFQRKLVSDGQYGGIVLDGSDAPKRTWDYNVRETQQLIDEESGLEVEVIQERVEQVWVPVISL